MYLSVKESVYNYISTQSEKSSKKQGKKENHESQDNWLASFKTLVPLDIAQLNIKNLVINHWSKEDDKYIRDFIRFNQFKIENIFSPNQFENNKSPIKVEGELNDLSHFKMTGGTNFLKSDYPFDLKLHLDKFNLDELNTILMSYVPLDIQSGEIELYSAFGGNINNADGYIKVFIDDLDIFSIDQEFVSPPHLLFEAIGGFASWLISDDNTPPNISTKVPMQIKNNEFNVSGTQAFWNSLNKYNSELKRDFEN